ncbi:uncharacterized protein [Elaeis guineensis]|uniref:uncharacterized protein isoform X4 n=1 Tax=Elaeis guineensis var. tenera TaxID=51953 RepID=UPI003C6DA2B8
MVALHASATNSRRARIACDQGLAFPSRFFAPLSIPNPPPVANAPIPQILLDFPHVLYRFRFWARTYSLAYIDRSIQGQFGFRCCEPRSMARSSFKLEHPLERRQAEAARIREKYPDRIPISSSC